MIGKANQIRTKLIAPVYTEIDIVINEFLETLDEAEVVDIKYTYQVYGDGNDSAVTALIIYKVKGDEVA